MAELRRLAVKCNFGAHLKDALRDRLVCVISNDNILCVNKRVIVKPYMAVLEINGKPLKMEVDTGAAVTLIFQATQKDLFPQAVL